MSLSAFSPLGPRLSLSILPPARLFSRLALYMPAGPSRPGRRTLRFLHPSRAALLPARLCLAFHR